MVAIFNGEGDPLQCNKHRSLRLLESSVKVFEKISHCRLRSVTHIMDGWCGFMSGKSCADAIFNVRRMQKKYFEKCKELLHVFVVLEKVFDRVPRKAIEWAPQRREIPVKLVKIVMRFNADFKFRMCATGGTSELFDMVVGFHQGFTLTPLLFMVVLKEVTGRLAGRGERATLYVDDRVLTRESREVTQMLLKWKCAMESKGLKINMEKTKMMVSGSSEDAPVQSGRHPCVVRGSGVGVNTVLCTRCGKWCHKPWSRIQQRITAYPLHKRS